MSTITASATIQALRFLFATHSLPEELVLDNDSQFVAQEMKDFLKSNEIRLTTLPQMVKPNCAVRTFKESMKTMKGEPGPLSEKLAPYLLGYRTSLHTATGCTRAELLMGQRIRTRLDLLHPNLSARISKKSTLADHSTQRDYQSANHLGSKELVKIAWVPVHTEFRLEIYCGNVT